MWDETAGGAFEHVDGGTCRAATGCIRTAAFRRVSDGLEACRQCKIVLQMGMRAKAIRVQDETKHTKVQPDDVPEGTCGCGCGAKVARTFLPGHDAKLKARRRREAKKKEKQS